MANLKDTTKDMIDERMLDEITEIESHTSVQFGMNTSELKIYIFGGFINERDMANRLFMVKSANKRTGRLETQHYEMEEIKFKTGPTARYGHSMVLTEDKEFYVFGGVVTNQGLRSNDLWKFNVETSEWTQVDQATNTALDASNSIESSAQNTNICTATNPCPRSGQSTIYDPVHKRIILFGGRKNKKADGDLNDLWEFDTEQGIWS